ncbi:hypothetical protein [uncultured Helicobacter sp.]|uniref:hypothetical protein n=1 Tax=uncultured Helicobacter sp. TaxID=175537 RepID=UPI00374FA3D1
MPQTTNTANTTQTYLAKLGDRLDSIYARFYGEITLHSYESGYNAFVLANIHLISNPVLQGGERVYLPSFESASSTDEVLGIWE